MNGTSAIDGKRLEGLAHLRQSVADILSTPLGSRVGRRGYGSRLFELVDRPVNPSWVADCYAFTAEALDRWEPRIRLTRVSLTTVEDGHPILELEGDYLPDGKPIKLEGIVA